ncbi:hypothetical protein PVK06_015354 [Gossypium arboreum]|uniref:Uncharacterized protein n=1 Tax=Gossypium arboreum TaxID=29729 RepID=A0ABR0PXA4_GOSAR|nr:hypothetical protein PVK06_015354 [Gossypium arboreum]
MKRVSSNCNCKLVIGINYQNLLSSKAKLNTKPAPSMAPFSCQGPNTITAEVIEVCCASSFFMRLIPKDLNIGRTTFSIYICVTMFTTDITAPGVDIIVAVHGAVPPTLCCPHVSRVAGLLRTLKRNWSPAAIMTTARTRQNMVIGSLFKATPFNYVCGHIRPNRAIDPGLVYALKVNDYLDFHFVIGYNQTRVRAFCEGPSVTCSEFKPCYVRP